MHSLRCSFRHISNSQQPFSPFRCLLFRCFGLIRWVFQAGARSSFAFLSLRFTRLARHICHGSFGVRTSILEFARWFLEFGTMFLKNLNRNSVLAIFSLFFGNSTLVEYNMQKVWQSNFLYTDTFYPCRQNSAPSAEFHEKCTFFEEWNTNMEDRGHNSWTKVSHSFSSTCIRPSAISSECVSAALRHSPSTHQTTIDRINLPICVAHTHIAHCSSLHERCSNI